MVAQDSAKPSGAVPLQADFRPGQRRYQSICWPHPRCCLMRPVHRLVSLPHGCWSAITHAITIPGYPRDKVCARPQAELGLREWARTPPWTHWDGQGKRARGAGWGTQMGWHKGQVAGGQCRGRSLTACCFLSKVRREDALIVTIRRGGVSTGTSSQPAPGPAHCTALHLPLLAGNTCHPLPACSLASS